MQSKDFLLIDVGNTRLKWACSVRGKTEVGEASEEPNLRVGQPSHADRRNIQALARRFPAHLVVVSCVVPALKSAIELIFEKRPLHIVSGESSHLNFAFNYPKPAELGADRLADCAAMFQFGKFPAVSINCGTATVLNVLDNEGRFCGGLIQPGLEVIRDSIVKRAAGLRKLKLAFSSEKLLKNEVTPLGKSTQEAIQNGALIQFRGGIQEAVKSIARDLGEVPYVYLTGGNAQWLVCDTIEHVKGTIETKALLTLQGLHIIGERWQASQSAQ